MTGVQLCSLMRQMGSDGESATKPTATPVATAAATPVIPDKIPLPEVVEAGKPAAATGVAVARKPPTTVSAAPSASAPPTPPPPTLTGDAACAEAKRLGENGDDAAAVRVFAGCTGPGAGAARAAIVRNAPESVRRRVFNGDCAGAKALVAALSAIGAAGGAAAVLDAAPQCKK